MALHAVPDLARLWFSQGMRDVARTAVVEHFKFRSCQRHSIGAVAPVFAAQVEVSVDDHLDLGLSHALALLARLVREPAFERKQHAQFVKEFTRNLRLAPSLRS
jgi:hypothetical protein